MMEMTIDNSCDPKPMGKEEIVDTLKTMVFGVKAFERFNAKEREALDKAWNITNQYEARLKADMVAMLEDLDLQIDELYFPQTYPEYMEGRSDCLEEIKELIQQKINSLKENTDVC